MCKLLIVLLTVARCQILLAQTQSAAKDISHLLSANGQRRITLVAQDQSKDPFLQNLFWALSKSGKFYTRIDPMVNADHGKVSHEDFYIFTLNSVRDDFSAVVNMVSKTKVMVVQISKQASYP